MDCKRLQKLVKSWYFQVQDELLAPARMIDFMNKHIADCPICMADIAVQREVAKLAEVILPPTKVRTPVEKPPKEAVAAASADAANEDDEEEGAGDQDDEGPDDKYPDDEEDENAIELD